MPATASELNIWRAQLDEESWPTASRLPAEERERAEALVAAGARRRWVAARWALRAVLGHHLEREPASIDLVVGERGKPRLADPASALRFNLSHSGALALIAVAWGVEVGVDVERIKPRGDVVRLARRALAPAEAEAVAVAPAATRLDVFHAAWTRREAIAKCAGTGLGAPPPEIPIAVAPLAVAPGFAAAVAVAAEEMPPLRYLDARAQTVAP